MLMMQGDEDIADSIEIALDERGGVMQANLLPLVIPCLRRKLVDRRLVKFIEMFPDRFRIQRGVKNSDLADVYALRTIPKQLSQNQAHPLQQQRATCVARELAESIIIAVRRFPKRGAGLWNQDASDVAWVPLPWMVREKMVGKKLQAYVLHSPILQYLHHHTPEVLSTLGEKGAWWATMASHLRSFLEQWDEKMFGCAAPSIRERIEVPCTLEKRGVASKLMREGYNCPCRIEVALPADASAYAPNDAEAEIALQKRIFEVLKGRDCPVHILGADLGVHASMRKCQAAGEIGLLQWLQNQPCFSVRKGDDGQWAVSPSTPESKQHSANNACDASDNDSNTDVESVCSSKLQNPLLVLGAASGVIAVCKPAGITTERTLAHLRWQLKEDGMESFVRSVSRLDRETSGVLVAALGRGDSAKHLKEQFASRCVHKEYICLCAGTPPGPVGHIGEVNCKLRAGKTAYRVAPSPFGKEALTRYEVLGIFHPPQQAIPEECSNLNVDELNFALRFQLVPQQLTLMRCWPLTGRTHQIRVHMELLGCPLVGDHKYSQREQLRRESWCQRLFLHCLHISLKDMELNTFETSYPLMDELLCTLRQLHVAECPFWNGSALSLPPKPK